MERDHLSRLGPPDAVVALRSYGRRLRELFRRSELTGDDLPTTLVVAGGWSLGALLTSAAERVAVIDRALERAALESRPELPGDLFERPAPPAGTGPAPAPALGPAVDRLAAAFGALADRVERMPAKDWTRPAAVGGRDTDAHEVLREAVAYGRTVLDEVAAVAEAVRRAVG